MTADRGSAANAARVGWVVLEFNQASGLPSVSTYSGFGGDVYLTREEAEDVLARTRAEMAQTPRRETYELAEVRMEVTDAA